MFPLRGDLQRDPCPPSDSTRAKLRLTDRTKGCQVLRNCEMDFSAGLQSGPLHRGEYYYIRMVAVKTFLEHGSIPLSEVKGPSDLLTNLTTRTLPSERFPWVVPRKVTRDLQTGTWIAFARLEVAPLVAIGVSKASLKNSC